MAKKQIIVNTRMLHLMDFCIKEKWKCTTQEEWRNLIGVTNIKQIRDGRAGFRHEHILKACEEYNISANWVYGLTEVMWLVPDTSDPVAVIEGQIPILKKLISTNKAKVNKGKK